MRDEMLQYYERELSFIRQMGVDFAKRYPKIGARLLLEEDKCEDPHVERLIEAFAFLSARIQKKIDDEFPEITTSLLNTLYPHYLAPIPSMSIVQFLVDPDQIKLTSGYTIERGNKLYSQPINDAPCRFQTCYPVTLWPVKVISATLESFHDADESWKIVEAEAFIRLKLQCMGTHFAKLDLKRLRFFLDGEGPVVFELYEQLLNNISEVGLWSPEKEELIRLPRESIRPVGFEKNEGMLPYPDHSFMGYRLIQEYFAFPEKFLFVEIDGLDRGEFGQEMEILFFLQRLPKTEYRLETKNFSLGCTPIVNLFRQIAEPIQLDHTQTEYRVIPDIRRQETTEIYSIDSVVSTVPYLRETFHYEPFYSIRHGVDDKTQQPFWYATRRPSQKQNDPGTEIYVTLVDAEFKSSLPQFETITVETTCTNRDLPEKLPVRTAFFVEEAAPLALIRCLKKPTPTFRLPLGGSLQWSLISHLSVNYLSISENLESLNALHEILKLYDFTDSTANQQQIVGITGMSSRRVVRSLSTGGWRGFCRGIQVHLELDEDKYVGSGVFLFASVLRHFLSLYASVNSFCELEVQTKQREGLLKRWPPMAGQQTVL